MFEVDNLKLRKIRVDAHLKQKDVAVRIGKESKHVSHYENGRAKPTADAVLNYLISFNVQAKDIAKKV